MAEYIVVENGAFKVIEAEKAPLNLVLKEPNSTWSNNDYVLVENGIQISWLDYYNDSRWKCLNVKYKGVQLQEINAIRKIQIVIDALNRFKNISEEELDRLYENALNTKKSELEIEVEKLKEEKKKLIEGAKTFTEFVKKGNELLSLMKDLDEEE